MPTVMRRTPATEEASSYGYIDFLKDVVQKTVADTIRGFKRPLDFSDEEIMQMAFAGLGGGISKGAWKMPITKSHLASSIPKEAADIVKKYKSQGLTYDAFVNQLPDRPEFAYHQWTFRGEGPLKRATVTTKGTSLDEFEIMVADRIRKFSQ